MLEGLFAYVFWPLIKIVLGAVGMFFIFFIGSSILDAIFKTIKKL